MKPKNITLKKGNMFDTECEVIVNTVNCAGIMGKGIALEAKNRFPEMYKDYKIRCELKQVRLGEPYIYKNVFYTVLNFPTKDHWRSVSKVEDIEKGLDYFIEHYKEWDIKSIAFPPLGCGNGGLEWAVIQKLLYRKLSQLDIPVEIYIPSYANIEDLTEKELIQDTALIKAKDKYSPEIISALEIVKNLSSINHLISRFLLHKIFYLVYISGVPINLEFEKSSYGPFSKQLKTKILEFVNNGLLIEEQKDRHFVYNLGKTYFDYTSLIGEDMDKYKETINVLSSIVKKFNSNQLELFTTTSFIILFLYNKNNNIPDKQEVVDAVIDWKKRRASKYFDEEKVSNCYNYIRPLITFNENNYLFLDFKKLIKN